MEQEKKTIGQKPQPTEVQKNIAAPTEPQTQAEPPKGPNDRLRERYPDADPQSQEDWDALRMKCMDEMDERDKNFSTYEKEIDELLFSDPAFASVVEDMYVNHSPFRVAIAKYISADDLKPKEGDEDFDAYQKAYEKNVADGKARAQRVTEIDANEAQTSKTIDEYCKKKGYDDKTQEEIYNFINSVMDAICQKKISVSMLEQLDKARTYDSAVATAAAQGELKGRNANIEAQKVESAAKTEGDGIPAPQTDTGGGVQEKPKRDFWDGVGDQDWTKRKK